ncbi:nickel pincer cofactor biosynthesis protein LarB, partial [Candidatus Auribacterota bacterium]
CERKTDQDALKIIERIYKTGNVVLATRASKELFRIVKRRIRAAAYNEPAGCITIRRGKKDHRKGTVVIAAAGTSDIPVAEEAAETSNIMGCKVVKLYDVGVSGIHRLLNKLPELHSADVIIAVAGMEGALPGVIGGLTEKPVIAVPTSVGYGANFGGVAPLLTMLNSCAPGVTVVNIDNGFGAGYAAATICGLKK